MNTQTKRWLAVLLATCIHTAYATGINDTGVTTCANDSQNGLPCPVEGYPRQDAEYGTNKNDATVEQVPDQHLSARSDGTVLQTPAKLMWSQCTEGTSGTNCTDGEPLILPWDQALQRAANSKLGGYTDWRLPNLNELESLLDSQLPIDTTKFPDHSQSPFWTATPTQKETGKAWLWDMLTGEAKAARMKHGKMLRLVRDHNPAETRTTSTSQPKECVNGDCILWEDVCTGGWNDVCVSYTDVCNGYEDVCDTYTDVCDAYTDVCDTYATVCTLYDDYGNCIQEDYDYSQCIASHQECSTSHQECTASHQECTGGWSQECDQTESQCAGWESQCTGGYTEVCTYTVTPLVGYGGTVSSADPQVISADSTASFTVTPDANYAIDENVGGDCPVGGYWSGNVWITGPISTDCTVEFSFTMINYTVTPYAGEGGTISLDTPQTISAESTASFTVTPNDYYTTDETVGGTCPQGSWDGNVWTTGSIIEDCTVNFTFTLITYTVTPSANPSTGGTISPSGVQTVAEGNTQSFTVTPSTNFVKNAAVTGTCPQGDWNGNTWTTDVISEDCTVIFNFTRTYIITPSVGANGTISPSGVQTVLQGSTKAFTLIPNTGYQKNLTVTGSCPQGSWNGNIWTTGVVTANCSVGFSFISTPLTITPSVGTGGIISPTGAQTVLYGSKKAFTLTPNTGYHKNDTVTGSCPQGSWSGNTWTTGVITTNCSVGFSFIINVYPVTPSVGAGGSVSPIGVQMVQHGSKKAFTLTPITGYLKNTTVTGTCPQGTWSNNTWTTGAITANCLVGFTFIPIKLTVTPSVGAGGTISPSGAQTVDYGAKQAFTVTPNPGYTRNAGVTGNCPQGSWNGNIWTTGVITTNCSVGFSFSIINYTVTATAGAGGSVSPTTRTVSRGNTTTFTVTPNAGYTRNNMVTGSCPQESDSWNGNDWTTGAITANCSLGFSFANDDTPPSVWLYTANPKVLVGKPITLGILVDTSSLKVAAYDFAMAFDTSNLVLDTSFQNSSNTCTDGVCPGTSALSSNIISGDPNNGTIRMAGLDPVGKGPDNDLQLLTAHFIARQTVGPTPVSLTLNNLATTEGDAIGTVAKGITVIVSPGVCGDSDGNGVVNIVDALSTARYTVGLPPPPTVNPTFADVDKNGRANIVDAMHISRYSVGFTVAPPVCAIGQPL